MYMYDVGAYVRATHILCVNSLVSFFKLGARGGCARLGPTKTLAQLRETYQFFDFYLVDR